MNKKIHEQVFKSNLNYIKKIGIFMIEQGTTKNPKETLVQSVKVLNALVEYNKLALEEQKKAIRKK